MSFGVEQSQGTGGQTLGGFIADKAMKSRDDAKKEKERQKKVEEKGGQVEDKDKKGLFRKALVHNLGGGFFSGKKSFGEYFNYKTPPKPESPKQQNPSGGSPSEGSGGGKGAGLAKILTGGFGSLVADTTAIQGGLTAITQLLNSQLQSSSFTATGISGITAILADQLEAQGEMIDLMGGNRPSGGASTAASGMFGISGSAKTGGKTLTEAMMEGMVGNAIRKFLQKGFQGALDKVKNILPKAGAEAAEKVPQAAAKVGAESAEAIAKKKLAQEVIDKGLKSKGAMINGKYVSIGAEEASTILAQKAAKEGGEGFLSKMGGPLSQVASKVGWKGVGTALKWLPLVGAVPSLIEAVDDARKGDIMGAIMAAGSAIPVAGWGFMAADITRDVVGKDSFDNTLGEAFQYLPDAMSMSGLSSGGVMLGEAGKEAVVDLNSSDAKAKGLSGAEDPGMKASGASMLAVVDQFVKGMGPLGTPVAQALGPDVQNLARQFGMSQVLPNLRIGGAKFRENANAKKERNAFLKDLIAGSLESLDAKKKDKQEKKNITPQTTNEQKTQSNPTNPETGSVSQRQQNAQRKADSGTEKPMDDYTKTEKNDFGRTSSEKPNIKATNVKQDTFEFIHAGDKQKYKVLLNYTNGDYEVFKVGAGPLGTDQPIDLSNPKKGGLNEALLTRAHNIVQQAYKINAPGRGATLKYISPEEAKKRKQQKLVNGDQEKGGTVVKAEGGFNLLNPFSWFSGEAQRTIDTAKSGKGGPIKSNSLVGSMLENKRREAQMMKELGYEQGGLVQNVRSSMFGVTKIDNKVTIEQRLDDVEKVLTFLSGLIATSPSNQTIPQNIQRSNVATPKVSAKSAPVTATNQVADGMSEMAVINVIQSGGSSPTIQKPQNSVQNTAEYASDPSCGGLASVLCGSSPWGAM